MSSIAAPPTRSPLCPEDGCGLPAVQVSTRELDDYIHELTGVCKLGHLWTTKWFAKRGA